MIKLCFEGNLTIFFARQMQSHISITRSIKMSEEINERDDVFHDFSAELSSHFFKILLRAFNAKLI